MVTRTGTGLAPNTGINQGNVGSELNACSIDPDRACDMNMNVAAGMDNPGILRALRKPRGPEPGKLADVEHSRGQSGQGGRAGPSRAGSRQLPASTGQETGGAGVVLREQGRSASQGVSPSDAPVVQVGVPVELYYQSIFQHPCTYSKGIEISGRYFYAHKHNINYLLQ